MQVKTTFSSCIIYVSCYQLSYVDGKIEMEKERSCYFQLREDIFAKLLRRYVTKCNKFKAGSVPHAEETT